MRLDLRTELAIAIVIVALAAVTSSFVALYNGTGQQLRGQIDAQLRTQAAEWRQLTAGTRLATPAQVREQGRRFLAAQRYHSDALVIVLAPAAGRPLTNAPELLSSEADSGSSVLLNAPPGLTEANVPEAGPMRILSEAVIDRGRRVGTLHLAEPLAPVSRAQNSLQSSFLVVGALAALLATVVAVGLAALIAAPLRRITAIAVAVSAGDLSQRAGPARTTSEVRALADAFDAMLDRLQRAFTRQRQFVSDASHELRTPLAVMRAQVELLDRADTDAARREASRVALGRLDELDRLVGDLLLLASAEGGTLIEPRAIDLESFFADLRRDLPLFGDRAFHVQGVTGTLRADPDRLAQVLRNLVRNAVTHTEAGDRIDVRARTSGDRVEIAVTDSGPGIPAGALEEIFERFHRLDAGRSRDRGGTGLGLAIARAIVHAHGGEITAESAPGAGATFRVVLPGYEPTVARTAGGLAAPAG